MTKKNEGSRILLHKVASLTSIRDIEVFEFSFLKTLAEMLRVKEICLYKFNHINEPCRLLRYASEMERSEAKHSIAEVKEIQVANIEVPEDIKRAKAWIDSTDKIYSVERNGLYHMVYPINGLKGTVGYLSLDVFKKLSSSETMVVESLLGISQNFHNLLQENQIDKLTGLLNRKTFDDSILKIQDGLNSLVEVEPFEGDEQRHKTNVAEFWLAIIDIDHFKRINDTFGHVYGDEVLLLLSQLMKRTFRPADLLFRFGGEEFIAIIKVDDQQSAEKIFDRFRVAIEEYLFPQVGLVTVSIGATQILERHAIASDIVGRADQALYHAKDNGRNKLYFYEDLIADGTLVEEIEEGDIELF